jgi:hypothetical protein
MKDTYRRLLAYVCVVAPLVILPLLLDGGLIHSVLSALALLGFTGTAIYTVTLLVFSKEKWKPSKLFLFSSAILASIALSFFAGKWYYEYQVSQTKKKLEVVFSVLDSEKMKGMAYPKEIDALVDRVSVPRLFRRSIRYSASKDGYVVCFLDAHALFNDEYVYSSSTKTWTYHLW